MIFESPQGASQAIISRVGGGTGTPYNYVFIESICRYSVWSFYCIRPDSALKALGWIYDACGDNRLSAIDIIDIINIIDIRDIIDIIYSIDISMIFIDFLRFSLICEDFSMTLLIFYDLL